MDARDADLHTSVKPVDRQQHERTDFAGFETSTELLRLVAKYPNLKSQLQSVWQATLEPAEGGQQSCEKARGGMRSFKDRRQRSNKGPWTPERGHQNGCDLLRELQESDEGVREFVDLIELKFGPPSRTASACEDDNLL